MAKKQLWGFAVKGIGLTWVTLIATSRVYLHAHSFPQVLAGAGIGFALMLFILWIDKQVKAKTYGLSLLLISLSSCIFRLVYPYQIPQAWFDRSQEFFTSIPQSPNIKLVAISFILSLACLVVHHKFKGHH